MNHTPFWPRSFLDLPDPLGPYRMDGRILRARTGETLATLLETDQVAAFPILHEMLPGQLGPDPLFLRTPRAIQSWLWNLNRFHQQWVVERAHCVISAILSGLTPKPYVTSGPAGDSVRVRVRLGERMLPVLVRPDLRCSVFLTPVGTIGEAALLMRQFLLSSHLCQAPHHRVLVDLSDLPAHQESP